MYYCDINTLDELPKNGFLSIISFNSENIKNKINGIITSHSILKLILSISSQLNIFLIYWNAKLYKILFNPIYFIKFLLKYCKNILTRISE